MEDKKRTIQQNNSLHLFLEQLSEEMRRNGITMKQALAVFEVDVPATQKTVKELLWRPLQIAVTDKVSTTDLMKQGDIDKIWDSLNLFFAEKFKMSIPPFPSQEVIEWNKEITK